MAMDALTATAIGGAAVAIISAVTTSIVTIMKMRDMNHEIKQVHAVVNGSNTVLIETNARLAARVAELTGETGDLREAKTTEAAASSKRESMAAIALNEPKIEAP